MLCPLCYSIRFTAARKVFSYVREQLSSRASCHTVPSPRGHILGSSNYIKVAPWGPRADFLSASLELSSNVAPALEIRPKDRTDANKATKASDTVTPASFQEVGDLLKRYGMDTSEIQQSPGLFSIPASLLEDRLEVFKECGWEKYTADMLIFTSILLFKMNAKDVIGSQNDSVTRSVLRCLLDVLEVQEDRQQHLISSISESSAVGYMTLSDCRTLAIRQYLRQLFSDEEIKSVLKTTMRTSGPFLPVRSIKNMLKLLMDDFKVPSARLLKHASMLTKGDRHYFHILKQQPRLLGMDLRVISSTMPRILLQSAEYLAELEDLFQRYNISAFQVSRQLTVISLAFDTVVRRLEGLKANPDLWRFHDLPDFLALVVKYVGVQTRVNFLRNMKVKNFGFPLLTCGNQQFHIALARGTLKGPTSSVQPQHLTPVAEWLDMPLVTVKKQLKSHIRNVPYFANDTKEIVEVLEVCQ